MLNATRPDKIGAHELLRQAASLGHPLARARLAWAELLGSPLPQNLSAAAQTFIELAATGQPESQMVRNVNLLLYNNNNNNIIFI
jgi:SEL1 protein